MSHHTGIVLQPIIENKRDDEEENRRSSNESSPKSVREQVADI
jgi:hypothetical protein